MLGRVRELLEELDRRGIAYCHWKSNFALEDALRGDTDIDILIRRSDSCAYHDVLSDLSFRPALNTDGKPSPSVEHHYGLDEKSGRLIHLHSYFRVITGESLAKNYRLPVEEMLLEDTRKMNGMLVPSKGAELVVFVLRMMLKHTTVPELVFFYRGWSEMRKETTWLMEPDSVEHGAQLIERWLPSLDRGLFEACASALETPASLPRRVLLGRRVRSRLRIYARSSTARSWFRGTRKFAAMVVRRFWRGKSAMMPLSGGAVIAVVGPEASGKSTLLNEIGGWLGEHFAVERIHAGKPGSTALSAAPNMLLPALRSLLPSHRSTRVEVDHDPERAGANGKSYPLTFAIRSVLLAYDRRALLKKAFSSSANGVIVLCDRYPSRDSGAPDSPLLPRFGGTYHRLSLRGILCRMEEQLYREIPAPDLVIRLEVPIDVAVMRNRTRGKYEPEDYVRRRHAQGASLAFGEAPVHSINTDQPITQTVEEVKNIVWRLL